MKRGHIISFDNLPVRHGNMRTAKPGVFQLYGTNHFVKIFSELYGRHERWSLAFEHSPGGRAEVERIARLYQGLAHIGYYPESSQFMVAKDGRSMYTVIGLIPWMHEVYSNIESDPAMRALREKLVGHLGISEDDLSHDPYDASNYGILKGRMYYHDMHFMPFDKMVSEEYRRMAGERR